jgi:type II secretory pathway component GspD/PulD (secretin)
MVVVDTPTKLNVVQEIIHKLDKSPKQIHVNVKLVELTDSDVEALGVNWAQGIQFGVSPMSQWTTAFPFDVSNGISRSWGLGDTAIALAGRRAISPIDGSVLATGDIFNLRHAVQSGLAGGNSVTFPGTPGNLSFGSMGFGQTSALFEMLRTKTSSRVIQAPQLVALDHEEATIQVGELVRYAESYIASTEGGGLVSGFREASNSPIKLGLQLLIIPHVTGPENNVLMTIVPKTENFNYQRSGMGGAPAGFQRFIGPDGIQLDLPQTNQRIVVTKMLLRNGETGVIGGLRQESENNSEVKVPVLGDIPFIGRLFKHRRFETMGSNLLVFVTPLIHDIELRDDFRKHLEKLKDEYSKPYTRIGVEDALLEKARSEDGGSSVSGEGR